MEEKDIKDYSDLKYEYINLHGFASTSRDEKMGILFALKGVTPDKFPVLLRIEIFEENLHRLKNRCEVI